MGPQPARGIRGSRAGMTGGLGGAAEGSACGWGRHQPDSCAQLSGKINCEGTFKAAAREGSAFLPAVVAQGLCREN